MDHGVEVLVPQHCGPSEAPWGLSISVQPYSAGHVVGDMASTRTMASENNKKGAREWGVCAKGQSEEARLGCELAK